MYFVPTLPHVSHSPKQLDGGDRRPKSYHCAAPIAKNHKVKQPATLPSLSMVPKIFPHNPVKFQRCAMFTSSPSSRSSCWHSWWYHGLPCPCSCVACLCSRKFSVGSLQKINYVKLTLLTRRLLNLGGLGVSDKPVVGLELFQGLI